MGLTWQIELIIMKKNGLSPKNVLLTVSIILFCSAVTSAQTVLRPLDLPNQSSGAKKNAYKTTNQIQWSSEKNCEVFDIRNCYLIFEKCKYQYYTDRGEIVKHGEIECTNGKHRFVWDSDWRNSIINVKGNYFEGKKNGQWRFEMKYVYKGKLHIVNVTANYKNNLVDGDYIYSVQEGDVITEKVTCSFKNGKPFGRYYEYRNNMEQIIYYDENGKKNGPMTINTEDEEHHGVFKNDIIPVGGIKL